MKKIIPFLLIVLAETLLRVPVVAQSYPVQATVQLTPPYSLYLADYASPGSNRIMANVLLRDLSRQDLQTRLRLTIEGVGISITTRPDFRPQPLYLQGGLPLMLDAVDLAPYFDPQNLVFQGISKQQIQKGGTLPEGLYRICIQVLDYNLGAEVSNQACGTAWLILNDPPIINLPRQGEKLRAQDPQNILFQWTPRHTGSPNSAFNTEYDFQLVELWPDNRDPNHAILSTPPIYEATTFSTSLVYGPAETPLEPGRKYAFRVRAKAMTGIEEMDLFKNGGYSEVYSFTYGDACTAPGVVSATTVSSSRVEVRWESAPFHTEFTVRYREKSKRGAKWQEKRTYASDLVVDGLLPETEYEFQVLGICGSLTGAASETVSMITSEEPATHFTCGAGPDAFDLENQDPLPELKWGDVFKAGDVEVTVLNVKGGNGTFSGTGLAEMPWLRHVKLRVDFSGVYINTDYQLLRGSVNSVFNPDSKMIVNLDGMDELFDGGGEEEGTDPMTDEEIAHEGEIADVTIDPATGAIVVINEDGQKTTYPQETDEESGEKKSVKIVDSQGDTWVVDGKGNVSKGVGANDGAPPVAERNEPLDFIVQFVPDERQVYGFDAKDHDAFNQYNTTQIRGEEFSIAWKSIETGRMDYIDARATGKQEFPSFIGFKTPSMPMASQPAGKDGFRQVNLIGGVAGNTDQLTAYALKEDGEGNEIEHELGVLNVVSYAKIRNKVVLVPVNGATVPAHVKQEINAVFAQSVVEWDVVIDREYKVDPAVLKGLDEGESGMLASFPKNMRNFIQAFKKARDEDKSAYYLFIIPGKQSSRAGFMPFKRQFGFVYPNLSDNLGRTIAHELAHGAFRLRHTFSPEGYMASKGSTDNLMDYPAGPTLRKYQWDLVHDPESMVGWFEDDDEGSLATQTYFVNYIDRGIIIHSNMVDENGNITYITPAGKPFPLPKTAIPSFTGSFKDSKGKNYDFGLPRGVLLAFREGNETFVSSLTCINGTCEFNGYKQLGTSYLKEISIKEKNTHKVIIGKEGEDCFLYIVSGNYDYTTTSNNNFRGEGSLITVIDMYDTYWKDEDRIKLFDGCVPDFMTFLRPVNYEDFKDVVFAKYNPYGQGGVLQKLSNGIYIYSNLDEEGNLVYYQYLPSGWKEWTPPDPNCMSCELKEVTSLWFVIGLFKEVGHTALDVGGLIPIAGELIDGLNGIWYTLEGNYLDATLSFSATVPIVGWVSIGGKYMVKEGLKIGKVIKVGSGPKLLSLTDPLSGITKKINDLRLSPELVEALTKDLKNESKLLYALMESPNLVDSWKRLIDAPDAIRKNVNLLDDVASWPSSWKITKSGDGMLVTNSSGKQLGTVYSEKIVAPGRKVSGETGNALINKNPLVKNMTYDVDGFIYKTDDLGRVLKTNADLDDVVRIRLGNQQIKAVDVKDGIRGTDQGGHIVGSRFFGPGEQINLYPQSANLNQGAWKQMENTWADAMVQGKDVKIQVEAVFNGTSMRPEAFEVSYWIDGAKTQRTFINQ